MGAGDDEGGTSYQIHDNILLAPGTSSQQRMDISDPVSTLPCSSSSITPSKSNGNNSAPAPARIKAYPQDSDGPYVVFFRPKGKRLNTNQISKDLTKRFSSVTNIDMVGSGKLRVTVGDRKQANEIVASELFTLEYRVSIPSVRVEISGVITDGSQTCEEIMRGCGTFRNQFLPPVEILECKQLHYMSQQGGEKVYSPSDSFRVTFSGSTLPNFVTIGKLRLRVRLFVPKVMDCTNCKQLGHTAQYCSNKPRCSSCGESHVDGACRSAPKCVYCNSVPPHALNVCPTYKRRQEQQRQSLKQRSRQSFAEMLKKAAPTVESANVYSSLSLDDQGSDSEVGDGVPFTFKGSTRKRVKPQRLTSKPQKLPRSDPKPNMAKLKADRELKRSSPQLTLQDEREFPPLPGTSKTPDVPTFPNILPEKRTEQKEESESSPMFTLSGVVDLILNFFNASDPVKNFVKGLLPCVTPFLKQQASKMPFLATIISFDG